MDTNKLVAQLRESKIQALKKLVQNILEALHAEGFSLSDLLFALGAIASEKDTPEGEQEATILENCAFDIAKLQGKDL